MQARHLWPRTRSTCWLVIGAQGLWSVDWSGKDNTGRKQFEDDIVFPTLDFPSDHAIISAKLSPILVEKP
eukprot:scaffold1973_cov399-Prasinococcus_capsulatus_cf.AAC.6